MNKLRIVVLCIGLLFMVGCNEITTTIETTTNELETTEITTKEESLYDVQDLSQMYSFYNDTIHLYTDLDESVSPVVNILEFVDVIDEGILPYEETESDGVLRLTFQLGYGVYEFYIEFDSLENTIYYNDFDMIMYMSALDGSVYESELELVDASQSNEAVGKTIDLDLYNIDIILSEGNYYIPLYLANQVLTGPNLNVYLNQDTVYLFDDMTAIAEYLSPDSLDIEDETALANETAHFTALLFDHYYGLKEILEIEDFKTELESFEMFDASSIETYDRLMQEFILSLDELHTTIIDLGVHNQDVPILNAERYSRYSNIIGDLVNYGGFQKPYTINFIEYDNFYHLDIATFDLDTKDYLANVLVDLDPEKPIYIDLSTNTGGTIISIFELLSYMTDDPMVLNYRNPATETIFDETYQVLEGRALENEFVIFTTNATYSAANLFTSLVKENNLGLIVGKDTGGGTAAVSLTVLPNNMIISYSSQLVMTDSYGMDVEYGVSPDIYMPEIIDHISEVYEGLENLYRDYMDMYLNIQGTSKAIEVNGGILDVDEGVEIDLITVTVYDVTTDQIIDTFTTNNQEFVYTYDFNDFQDLLYVVATVDFTIGNHAFTHVIEDRFLDNMSDELGLDTITVPIEETFIGFKDSRQDSDFVKIEIIETGNYAISFNEVLSLNTAIFDQEGNRIQIGDFSTYLEPGTYYLGFSLYELEVGEAYFVYIDKKIDDNVNGTPLTLDVGTYTVALTYDFSGDLEWIDLTVPQESLITVTCSQDIGQFNILTSEGDKVGGGYGYMNTSEPSTFILPLGSFVLNPFYMQNSPEDIGAETFTFIITVTIPIDDYSGDLTLTDQNFGTMVLGENTVTLDAFLDRDIFVYEAEEATQLLITDESDLKIGLITDVGVIYRWGDSLFDVEAGLNYFYIYGGETALETPIPFQVIEVRDTSTYEAMTPLTIGEAFTIIIEEEGDFDYFSFTVSELTTYQYLMADRNDVAWWVYNANDESEYLFHHSGFGMTFQLAPGDYYIKATHKDNFIYEMKMAEATLVVFETVDSDPNMTGLDESFYTKITLPLQRDEYFEGAIEYEGDIDVFLVEITEAGNYAKSAYSMGYVQLFILIDGEKISLQYGKYIEAGTYYLIVEAYSYNDEYKLTFGEPEEQ